MKINTKDTLRIYLSMEDVSASWRMSVLTDIETDVATLFSQLGNRFVRNNVFGNYNEEKKYISLKFLDNKSNVTISFEKRRNVTVNPFLVEIMKNNDPTDEPIGTYFINNTETYINLCSDENGFMITGEGAGQLIISAVKSDVMPLSEKEMQEIVDAGSKLQLEYENRVSEIKEEIIKINNKIEEVETGKKRVLADIDSIQMDNCELNKLLSTEINDSQEYFMEVTDLISKDMKIPSKKREHVFYGYKTKTDIIDKGILSNMETLKSDDKRDLQLKKYEPYRERIKSLLVEYVEYEEILEDIRENN